MGRVLGLVAATVTAVLAAGCGGSARTALPATTTLAPPPQRAAASTVAGVGAQHQIDGITYAVPAGWTLRTDTSGKIGNPRELVWGPASRPDESLYVAAAYCDGCQTRDTAAQLTDTGRAAVADVHALDRRRATFTMKVPAPAWLALGSNVLPSGDATNGQVVVGTGAPAHATIGGKADYAVAAMTLPAAEQSEATQILGQVQLP